ncbi:UNVERIFIED_CONTAM: hypothetical protein Sradi_7136900 [Sesamum radiatum]|uniref:Uncharacterized protein n=1 Tax=Sesamum radiatum TaxID=300843 RepID=A0AAW2IXF6_SESRA
MTTRRWAWKQPSFEESVIAHWSSSWHRKCIRAQVIHRSDETLKAAFSSVSSGTFCQSGKVFLVTRPGDIRSENADMSNEKSCEKHDRLPVEGFLRSVNLRRVNRSLRNPKGLPSDGYTKVTKLL